MIERIDLLDRRRIFFVGDLHGDWKALHFFLQSVKFTYRDAIVSVGDLIDRGDDSLKVLNFFLFTENAYAVRGNHEDMAIRALLYNDENQAYSWMCNGGEWMMDYPREMLKGMMSTVSHVFPLGLQVEIGNTKIGVLHAECPTDDWEIFKNQVAQYYPWKNNAVWGRNKIEGSGTGTIKGVDWTIHGHTVRKGVTTIGNQMWIDTGSVFDVGSGKYALTVLEWDNGGFTTHRIERDAYEPKGIKHLIL